MSPGARDVDLSALVGSRICHDLISPLGAIGNGVELLAMSHRIDGPEMALIGESVEAASARLRFFRIAFGHAGAEATLGRGEIHATLAAVSRGGKLAFTWEVEREVPRREARVAFLILQCFESAMPFGGAVTVARSDADDWALTATGSDLRIDPGLWESLLGKPPPEPPSPALVQFALLPQVLADYGMELGLELAAERIRATF
ncbi:histidine phosphotransferase family protein [Pseudoroseicyclus sp. CXY001]|uniref:histidine phosphotransferase family protein n=1 Tax=Pseudoroseicyclus sp. CXY001 TaxID=3242492 RepID=UPI00358DCFB0